jgi:hypothetical protein
MPKGYGRSEEDNMHPMFVKLFLEADATTCWPRRRTSVIARTGPGTLDPAW